MLNDKESFVLIGPDSEDKSLCTLLHDDLYVDFKTPKINLTIINLKFISLPGALASWKNHLQSESQAEIIAIARNVYKSVKCFSFREICNFVYDLFVILYQTLFFRLTTTTTNINNANKNTGPKF